MDYLAGVTVHNRNHIHVGWTRTPRGTIGSVARQPRRAQEQDLDENKCDYGVPDERFWGQAIHVNKLLGQRLPQIADDRDV
jgi:hypothetical protein